MLITFLGHAGFLIETESATLVVDPWLSPSGAFDSSWFQFPRNHHLATLVQEKLADSSKPRYVYISHEHRDHFDRSFLDDLSCRDFTFILPRFRRPLVAEALADYQCRDIVLLGDQEELKLNDAVLKLYLDDAELNRDSAMLLKTDRDSFLNLNDCKVFDALPGISRQEGRIDVLASQFSGANWHPVCYDYSPERYRSISRKKVMAKFNVVAQAIKAISPAYYLATAGPACFLDPMLADINFQEANIFPQAWELRRYLDRRFPATTTSWPEFMPGDILDVTERTVRACGTERVGEADFHAYLKDYIAEYHGFFQEREKLQRPRESAQLTRRLTAALQEKLNALELRNRVGTNLYFGFSDLPGSMVRVNFSEGNVTACENISEPDYYLLRAPSWQVGEVLDSKLTWEDFTHTFRIQLSRRPDVYQKIITAFIRMDPPDLGWFCTKILNGERHPERILKQANGVEYTVDRRCPHQGGDLLYAWVEDERYLVCPRHGLKFDLQSGGACVDENTSVHAQVTGP